jgi:hypothetical protein
VSTFNRMLVFPEGHSAQEVLAVDLDEDTTAYLSTYPGTARWLSAPGLAHLQEGLDKVGKTYREVPGLLANLRPEPSITDWPLLFLVVASNAIVFMVLGMKFLPPLVCYIIGIVAAVATLFLTRASVRRKRQASINHDEQVKRIYDERLQEAADNIVSIDDPDADDVREALAHAEAIHDNLKLLRRFGLSTLEESEAVDEHLATLLRAHIAERASQPRLERFEEVLRDVDRKTIADDTDLQNIQRLRDELAHTAEAARQKATAAMGELNQLEKETTATVRRTEAKLQAAELTGQEDIEL